jgi:hypothetical protein
MNFELEVLQNTVAMQENVTLRFSLHNDGPNTKVPFDYDSTDVLTILLLDTDGQVVCRANGYDRMERHGVWERRVPQIELETGDLPSDATMIWENDLLVYMDVPEPGRYSLLAEFKFQPSGIELQSQRIELEVTPNNPGWIDVMDDYVSIGMTYVLQRTESRGSSLGLLQLALNAYPATFWKGGILPLPVDAEPLISEADFATSKTFDHDLFRWIVWIKSGNLQASRFSENSTIDPICEYLLGNGDWKLAGRPVQHIDFSVSIPVMNQLAGQSQLKWLNFSDKFELQSSAELPTPAVHPQPVVTASDWFGMRYITFAEAGQFPIHLVEMASDNSIRKTIRLTDMEIPAVQREINLGNSVRVLALRVRVKGGTKDSRALLIVIFSEGEYGKRILLGRMPLETDLAPGDATQIDTIDLTHEILANDELLVGGAIAEATPSELHAVLTTSQGQLIHITKSAIPKLIEQAGYTKITAPGPFLTTSRDIHLFSAHCDRHGIIHRMIYQGLRH